MNLRAAAAEQVYLQLKADVRRGRYLPGAALNIHLLATETGVSVSPVRDAMERLVGERLLEIREGGGFQMPPMTIDIAGDLYEWHARLMGWAILSTRQRDALPDMMLGDQPQTVESDRTIVTATAELFAAIADTSGSAEHVSAVRAVSDRLSPLRYHETCFKDRREELQTIGTAFLNKDGATLRSAVAKYHFRRARRLKDIVSSLFYPS